MEIFYLIIHLLIYIFLLLHFCIFCTNINHKILTLSNGKTILVSKDSIHIFTPEIIEEKSKLLRFNQILSSNEIKEKIEIAKFTQENEEYIIILIMNKIYFFDKDGTKINFSYLSDEFKNINYSLASYKKENNYLYYFITYPSNDKKTFILNYFKFAINSPNSNNLIISKEVEINSQNEKIDNLALSKITCTLMSPQNYLVCFYVLTYDTTIEIEAKVFDPKNKLNEIKKFSKIREKNKNNIYHHIFISAEINEEKTKAFIYIVYGYPYALTFDLENSFSEFNRVIDINFFKKGESQHKLFYLKEKKEFLIASLINYKLCKIFIAYYNSNFEIIYQGVIEQNYKCQNLNSFSSFQNGTLYTILNENNSYHFKKLNKKRRNLSTKLEKCENSSDESELLGLCLSCAAGYHPAETPANSEIDSSFIECYNEETKPNNFYFNIDEEKYKPCYETCGTCNEEGTIFDNKCETCALNHRKKPNKPTDCVTLCTHFYYYTFYGQYKCSSGSSCPENSPFYILDLGKCTDDCSNEIDSGYIYLYGGQCLNSCPISYTHLSDDGKSCIDNEDNSCIISKVELEVEGGSLIDTVNSNVKKYSEEFSYTTKHISYLYNKEYSILIYQESECIELLSVEKTKMDFGECYSKVQQTLDSDDKLIIALIERSNSLGQSTSIFYFYNPNTGEKMDIESICKDETIIVKENILGQLNKTSIDMNTFKHLTAQNIDVFSLSGEFYTDICFHFDSPNGKDVPLKDRVLAFYPNISLCDDDCASKGVNLTSMESICECSLGGILNNDLISGNPLLENTLGDIMDFIGNSNLDVMKCFKDVFKAKYFKKNTGGIIILIIIIFEIFFAVLFLVLSMKKVARYLYHLSEFFSNLIVLRNKQKKKNQGEKDFRESLTNKSKVRLKISEFNAPPKKESNKNITKKKKNDDIIENKPSKYLDINSINENKQISQKSLDFLNKDKLIREKLDKNILKDDDKKSENIKETKKNDVEIFQLFKEDLSKIDIDKEIKELQEKYNIDEQEFLKEDPDDMEYDDAIKYDKRTFCQYFYDKFMENQIIMNTFFNHDYLKPITIKVILLLLNIDLYFVVNGLFYSESYISELFHSDEEETFFSFFSRSISRIFYTTIIDVIISSIIDCMFIEEKKIKRIFKREKEDYIKVKHEISLIIKSAKKNNIIFLIVCFFISLVSWYYVCCFNNVYPGVKGEWIKSSIAIMIIMQLLSFFAGLVVALIRLISFQCKSEKLYKLKDFFN